MKLLNMMLEINLACLLPMLLWLLGAFALGWLLKHLLGGGNNKKALHIEDEYNALRLKHNTYVNDSDAKYRALESKFSGLQTDYSADASKLGATLLLVDKLKGELEAEKSKAPVSVEKIVEKKVEFTPQSVLDEIAALKLALEAEKNKAPKIEEKIVEKKVEFTPQSVLDEIAALKLALDAEKNKAPKIEEKIVEKKVEFTPQSVLDEIASLKLALDAEKNKAPKIEEKIVEKRVEVETPPANYYKVLGGFFGKKITFDDLKLVEGIGPKIEELFHNAGLKTWAAVAQTDPAKLKEILVAGGERFQMHDPATWPKQCQMMVDGNWDELKKYQDELTGGKEES